MAKELRARANESYVPKLAYAYLGFPVFRATAIHRRTGRMQSARGAGWRQVQNPKSKRSENPMGSVGQLKVPTCSARASAAYYKDEKLNPSCSGPSEPVRVERTNLSA